MRAFHQQHRKRDIATKMYQWIRDYYKDYASGAYFALYTLIIGPSGIGKSYMMQQLAYQNCCYVIYASSARPGSTVYPSRSPIADAIFCYSEIERMTIFFECYIAAGLVHVKLCKILGITPAGFFDLHVEEAFVKFQLYLVKGIRELHSRVTDEITKSRGRPERSQVTEKK